MAKQLNISLGFSADTSRVKSQLQDLQNQLQKLTLSSKTELGITKDIEGAAKAAAELSVHLQKATNVQTGTLDFAKLNQSIKQSGTTLQQYGKTLQSLGPQGQQTFMSLAQAVANSEVPIRRTNKLIKEMGTVLANTARWQLSSSMLHGFMGAVQSAYGYAQDLNESLNNIRIVTGQNIDQMAKFAAEANKAARALSATTTDYTNASLIYYQQGLADQQVKERTDITIKMANVSRQSAEIVSDQMTAVWNNFYNGSKSLEHYADVMTALGAATASSSEEIATGLEKFAAIADTVGLSYEYAASALATVTSTTRQSAEVVGTAFKTLFARIQDLELGKTLDDGTTLGKYSQALSAIGIQIKDANGEMKDMDAILNEMGNKWSSLSKDTQVAVAQAVAGTRQYSQLVALMDNWDFMQKNLATSNSSSGALQAQADIYAESWEAAQERVTAAAERIYSSLVNDEFFIDLLNGVEKVLTFVNQLIDSLGGLKGVLTAVGAIVTKVFSNQLAQGFTNIAYNLRMLTEKGRQAEKDARKKVIDDAIDNIPQSKDFTTGVEKAQRASMRSQLELQSQYMENADRMNTIEAEVNKKLMDRVSILRQQVIEAEKRKEIAEKSIDDASFGMITDIAAKNEVNRGKKGYVPVSYEQTYTASIKPMKELVELQTKAEVGANAVYSAINKGTGNAGDAIVALKKQIKGSAKVSAEVKQIFASLNQNSQIDDVEAAMRALSQSLSEGIGRYSGEIKKAIGPEATKRIEQYVAALREKTRAELESKNASEQAGKAQDKASQSIQNSIGAQKGWADILVESANLVFSVASAFQMLDSAINTIMDPDVSGWDKFLSIMMTLGMIIPTFISIYKTLKSVISLETVAKIANAAATMAQTAAEQAYGQVKGQNNAKIKQSTKETWKDTWNKLKNKGQNIKDTWNANAWDGLSREEKRARRSSYLKDNNLTRKGKGYVDAKGNPVSTSSVQKALQSRAGKDALKGLGTKALSLTAGVAAIAIVAGTIALATKQINAHEEALASAKEQAKEAATAFQAVSGAYNDFTSNVDAYTKAQNELQELTRGTEDYTSAVIKANEATLNLLNQYEDLTYTIDSDGLITIDEASLNIVKNQQQKYLKNAQYSNLTAQQRAKDAQIHADSINFQRQQLRSNNSENVADYGHNAAFGGVAGGAAAALGAVALMNGWNPIGWTALIVGAVVGAMGGLIGTGASGTSNSEEQDALNKLAKEFEENGNQNFTKENFDTLLGKLQITDPDLIASLKANREATLDLVKEMALNNQLRDNAAASRVEELYGAQIRGYGVNKEQVDEISHILGSQIDTAVAQKYESEYRDKLFGITDAEIQKAYAKEMGWAIDTTENLSDNKAKYFKKDGTEVGIISDEVARRYLAEKAVYQELASSIKIVSKKFQELSSSVKAYDQALAKFILDKDFNNISQEEFDKLKEDVDKNKNGEVSQEEATGYININFGGIDAIVSDEEAAAYGFNSAKDFYETFLLGFNAFTQNKNDAIQSVSENAITWLKDSMIDGAFDNLSSNDIKQAGSLVDKITKSQGEAAGQMVASFLGRVEDSAGELAVAFNDIDWSTATPDSLLQHMAELGMSASYADYEIADLIATMKKISAEDFSLTQWLTDAKEFKKLQQGDIINLDQFKQLPIELQSYFTLMSDGTFKLTQDALDFYQAVSDGQLIHDYVKQNIDKMTELSVSQELVDQDVLANNFYDDVNAGWDAHWDQWSKQNTHASMYGMSYIKGVDKETGQATIGYIPTYDDPAAAVGAMIGNWVSGNGFTTEQTWTASTGQSINTIKNKEFDEADAAQATKQLEFLKTTSWGKENAAQIEKWAKGEMTAAIAYDIGKVIEAHGSEFTAELDTAYEESKKAVINGYKNLIENATTSEKRDEYFQDALEQGFADEVKSAYEQAQIAAINQEAYEGLNLEEISQYGAYLEEIYNLQEEEAEEAARSVMKMNRGLKNLSQNYKEWSATIDDSAAGTEDAWRAFNGMKTALSDLLDISEEFIDNDFIKDHMVDIGKAADGDKKAIKDLGLAMGKYLVSKQLDQLSEEKKLAFTYDNTSGETAIAKFKNHLDDINKLVSDLKPADLGTKFNINTDEIASKLAEVVRLSGMSVEQANAYYRSMGFTPVYEEETVPADSGSVTVKTIHGKRTDHEDGSYTIKETVTEEEIPISDAKTTLPKLKIKTLDGEVAAENITSDHKVKQTSTKPSHLIYTGGGSLGNITSPKGGNTTKSAKKSDVVERYREINQSIEDSTRAMDRASKAADRLWGQDRINQLAEINDELERQIDLYGEKTNEAATYLAIDKSDLIHTLENAGITNAASMFDGDGRFTGGTEVLTNLYNQRQSYYNNKRYSRAEDMDEIIEGVRASIKQYDDTFETWQQAIDSRTQAVYDWQSNNYEQITGKLEFKIELNQDSIDDLNRAIDKMMKKINTAADAAEVLAQYEQIQTEYAQNFNHYQDTFVDLISKYYGEAEGLNLKEQLSGATDSAAAMEILNSYIEDYLNNTEYGAISQADFKEGLDKIHDGLVADIEKLEQMKEALQDYYGNIVTMAIEEIQLYVSEMEHLNSVLDHYSNIIDLVGKKEDRAAKRSILQSRANNIEKQYQVQQKIYTEMSADANDWYNKMQTALNDPSQGRGSNAYETYKKNWEAATQAANEAQDQMLAHTEEWAETMKSIIESELEDIADTLEESLTGGISFDELLTSMERRSSLQEEYLTSTNKIYETNKLMRQAQQEIDKTANTVAKRRLQSFINETNEMQNQNKLSQYELDIQQAKYDLLLAEIALEEAQNAKSTVRLQRDAEGNFGYVYTADSNAVADAEQNLADAQNKLYNIGLDGANDYAQKYAETMQESQDAITELTQMWMNGEIATTEEFNRRKQEIVEFYGKKLQQYSELHTIALSTDSRIAGEAWSSEFMGVTASVEQWQGSVDGYFTSAATQMNNWGDVCSQALEKSNLDDLDTTLGEINTKSNNLYTALMGDGEENKGIVGALMGYVGAAQQASDKNLTMQGTIDGLTSSYEKLLPVISKAREEMELVTSLRFNQEDNNSGLTRQRVSQLYYEIWRGNYGNNGWNDRKTKILGAGYSQAEFDAAKALVNMPGGRRSQITDDQWKTVGLATGGYTGSWDGSYGKLAFLHQKELVLNAGDTENFLASMEVLERILRVIDLHSANSQIGGLLSSPVYRGHNNESVVQQDVRIEASFPSVTDRNEIEEAFNNLVNRASQFANRK